MIGLPSLRTLDGAQATRIWLAAGVTSDAAAASCETHPTFNSRCNVATARWHEEWALCSCYSISDDLGTSATD
jgi:hypothetical protein